MTLALLHTLHAHPLTFHRVGERLKVLPAVPEEARPVLGRFKPALLRALEDGERVEARALLSSPFRLLALLAHALGVEGEVALTLYPKELAPATRYRTPEELTPYLAWADRNFPLPRRLHLSPTTGGWSLDLREGWKVAVEALAGGTRYLLLLLPALEARVWLEAAGKGLTPSEEVSVWTPGEEPFTARGWREALAHLEEVETFCTKANFREGEGKNPPGWPPQPA